MIVHQSELYAQKANVDLALSTAELRVFLAILLLSGFCCLPRQHMYWESSEDTHNLAVVKAMGRPRFLEIKRFLHFEDEVNKENRFTVANSLSWKSNLTY